MSANTVDQLSEMKHTYSPHMSDKALKYLNSLNNHEQYPSGRVNMWEGIYMYLWSASSSVESTNNPNKSIWARIVVDPVNLSMLLLQKENERFLSHMEMTFNWKEDLTPHGLKLRDEIFKMVKYGDYSISHRHCQWY